MTESTLDKAIALSLQIHDLQALIRERAQEAARRHTEVSHIRIEDDPSEVAMEAPPNSQEVKDEELERLQAEINKLTLKMSSLIPKLDFDTRQTVLTNCMGL